MSTIRIGHGFDVHQLVVGRKCIIGGVDIAIDRGLLGHSDADVLLHAAVDAFELGVRVGKVFANITQCRRAQQRITNRMQQHVGIRMAEQAAIKGNINAADNAFSADH